LEKQGELITVLQKSHEECQQRDDVLLIDAQNFEYAPWIHQKECISLESSGWNQLDYFLLSVGHD